MISRKFCPRCESENIEMVAGGIIGSFMCEDCGFSGSVFPEKTLVGKEDARIEKKQRARK